MDIVASPSPLVVVALGGNALLRRGEAATAAHQQRAARAVAAVLGPVSERARLVVTHGNGPQVGLLALKEDAYADGEPYPLDVLDAESGGQIGYVVELELDNAIDHQETVTVLTRVLVDADDPAFGEPSKFIGPVYDEELARTLARERGWDVKPDGDGWRRVVASPEPQRIVQLAAIRRLVDGGFLVVCVGGGGIPVVTAADGHEGVEAVVDKDLASALLAEGLGADVLVLATDVDGVFEGWGTPDQRVVARTSPGWLRERSFASGSMGPKVEAACRFVEASGGRAAIGGLDELAGLVDGTAGTQVVREPSALAGTESPAGWWATTGEHPIVACYDGIDSSDAVQLGALVAAATRQPLVIASAYRYEPAARSARVADAENSRRFDAAEARVQRARRLVPDGVEVRERALPAEGISAALIDLAHEVDASALVTGRDLHGDVTRSVIEHARCPVIVTPFGLPLPAAEPIRRVGVAYDGSPGARFALAAALHLAVATDAEVQVICVGTGPSRARVDVKLAAAALPREVAVDVRRVDGDPGTCLVEASDRLDLLFCGSRGRGRVLSAVLGSVSSHLVRAAHCPTVVIPPRIRHRTATPLGLTTAGA